MANEITTSIVFKLANGNLKRSVQNGTLQYDQAAQGSNHDVWTIGTSEEDISWNDITTEGWLYLRNLDATNYVTWGPKSGAAMVAMGRLEPGEEALLRMEPSTVLRMQANTASCKVDVLVFED